MKSGVFKVLMLIGALVVGMWSLAISAKATTEEVAIEEWYGFQAPIEVEYFENLASDTGITGMEHVSASATDIAYWSKFDTDYYYNRLTTAEKVWWDRMEAACIEAAVSKERPNIFVNADEVIGKERMRELAIMFMYNHPQYYFLSHSYSVSDKGGGISVYSEFMDGEARWAATQAFRTKIDGWVAQVQSGDTQEKKEKIAHDIVCNNTAYKSNSYDQSAYSMVCLGQTVCTGYAKTLQLLLNAAGVETVTVTSDSHAWNVVNLYGHWYQVDATQDDLCLSYKFYNKSRQTYQATSNIYYEKAMWNSVLTDARYDMFTGSNYSSGVFSSNYNTYFIVNDNTSRGNRTAMLLNAGGVLSSTVTFMGKTYTLTETGAAPVIYDVRVTDLSKDGYTVQCKVSDESGITRVSFPTWSDIGWQDDLSVDWYNTEAVFTPDKGVYSYRVNTSGHNNDEGTYYTHIYAYDAYGYCGTNYHDAQVNIDRTAPIIDEVRVEYIASNCYSVVCSASDPSGIAKVCFPTWSEVNGQDDLANDWVNTTAITKPNESGEYLYEVFPYYHGGDNIRLFTHVYAYDTYGNYTCNTDVVVDFYKLKSISVSKKSLELKEGSKKTLSIVLNPTNAWVDKDAITWTSSNTKVATVSNTGVVKAVGRGEAIITVTLNNMTAQCVVNVVSAGEKQVEAFVERMYTVALGRASDPSGIAYWTNQLLTHQKDGASIADGFIRSSEFINKNYSDQQYLEVLYRTFFNREPDAAGCAYWIQQINTGTSRDEVLAGFVNSKEFDELCTSYGIVRGTMVVLGEVHMFVERIYNYVLCRGSDRNGVIYWGDQIKTGQATPEQVAKMFYSSDEHKQLRMTDDSFIYSLYWTFMDREPDEGGMNNWMNHLRNGMSRMTMVGHFAQSPEFQEIVKRYGL